MSNAKWLLAAAMLFAGAAGAADQATPPAETSAASEAAKVEKARPGKDDDCDGVKCASQTTPEAQALAIKQKGLPGKSSSKKENEAQQKKH